ncbi:MAG: hypothetical protein GY705_26260 [Bacteroidetes bacterium]|nr:hypothetical protein [Bacteroidota bacterium]
MLNIFRTNQILASIIYLPFIVVLRVSAIWFPLSEVSASRGAFSELVYNWIGVQGIVPAIVAMLVLFFQAILVNLLVMRNRLANDINLFPGLVYILFASCIPNFLYLSPMLMANTFLLIALWNLMQTYKTPASADWIFNTGFWIGIASLFYFPYIWFFFAGFVGLNILRAFRINERMMLFIGIIVPYFLTAVYFFLQGQLLAFWKSQIVDNLSFFDIDLFWDWIAIVKIVFFGLLFLLILASYNQYVSKKTIDVQKKISILIWTLFIGIFAMIFQSNVTTEQLLILTLPLGIFFSFNLTLMQSRWAEITFLLLTVGVLAFQLYPHFV